jgi:dihydroxyacetone kinase
MNSTGDTKHRKHTIAWKRIDDHTTEQQINHDDGKEHSTGRYVVSPDGKGLTITIVVQQPDGTLHQTGFAQFARQ